ncbi:hypothetical protein [Marinomonas sp. FW-1]|uniref:hypothetical protein n=1 Tax=Marinomonas sp. FW-1 TaxID=2071621 RepID=UPI0010C14053|nr:hypothetical protein [Marinomonas sp. FW-1]
MEFNKCTSSSKNKITKIHENKSELIIKNNNNKTINKIKVDGCLIGDKFEKCDYIVTTIENNKPQKAFFIELKGCKIEKAINQLDSTLNLTKTYFEDYVKECYIICTRVPKSSSKIQKMRIIFSNNHKSTLSIKTTRHTIEC